MKTKIECPRCIAWLAVDFGQIKTLEHDGTEERAAEIQAHIWLSYGKSVYEEMLSHWLYECVGDGSTRHLEAVPEEK